jgi:K+-sensing histidine kinase KdpD
MPFAPLRLARYRYLAAILLAVAAQVARMPFHVTTAVPFITYVPFVVVSALLGGFGPGILTTVVCTLEIAYFALEPIGSFSINDQANWHGIGAFVLTGVVTSLLAERLE